MLMICYVVDCCFILWAIVITVLEDDQRTAVDVAEDRRIVTILFTDIVNSSLIASRLDPEDWREVVAAVHRMAGDTVQEYGGTVVQYLGDGLLALFGVHSSSERDPESAVSGNNRER